MNLAPSGTICAVKCCCETPSLDSSTSCRRKTGDPEAGRRPKRPSSGLAARGSAVRNVFFLGKKKRRSVSESEQVFRCVSVLPGRPFMVKDSKAWEQKHNSTVLVFIHILLLSDCFTVHTCMILHACNSQDFIHIL